MNRYKREIKKNITGALVLTFVIILNNVVYKMNAHLFEVTGNHTEWTIILRCLSRLISLSAAVGLFGFALTIAMQLLILNAPEPFIDIIRKFYPNIFDRLMWVVPEESTEKEVSIIPSIAPIRDAKRYGTFVAEGYHIEKYKVGDLELELIQRDKQELNSVEQVKE